MNPSTIKLISLLISAKNAKGGDGMTDMLKAIIRAQEMAKRGELFAQSEFIYADPQELILHCNGCGAAGSWIKPPDTIYGTSILESCIIHDDGYHRGQTIEDKEQHDRIFRNNMIRQIMKDSHKWYKPTKLQLARVNTYFQSVSYLGGPAFWDGKNA